MKWIFTFLLLAAFHSSNAQTLTITALSCEHRTNPVGIDVKKPRLSWKISGTGRNIMQTAYSIRVATNSNFKGKSVVWQSGKIDNASSVLQEYAGVDLLSGKRYYWQVKVWDQSAKESDWSSPSYWEMGLLAPSEWQAQWIEPQQSADRHMPGLLMRREFQVQKKIASARAYVTSHGFYELYINGKKAGDRVLTPGWTSYNNRLQYQVYDISSLLQPGANCSGAMLADGWYRGSLAWENNWGTWGKKLGLLCQIRITFTDGSEQVVASDANWKGSQQGPIIVDGIYDGETYDARKEIQGWSMPGFKADQWQTVTVADISKNNLVADQSVPVRKIQEVTAKRIFTTPKGLLVVDFGQNLVGWVRLKVKGPAGTRVVVRHAEVLDKTGNFYTDNLRAAAATAEYVLKGQGDEVYEPRFSFFGFRYASVTGYPGELKPGDITGIVVHSDMTPTGSFECSDPLVNQLQHNIQWGQKGNFVDVPTDCPQRDERLGWTGDAQAFCRTAAFNMDVASFFTKWLKDVSADQYPDGQVPFVIPDVLRNKGTATSAGWGDVSTIAPWTMYQVFGDKRILETQYSSMKAYVDYIRQKAGDSYLWKDGSVFGDWLFYKSMRQTENDGYTSPDMIATMFFAYSASLVAKAAAVLGNEADQKLYHSVFENVKRAFNKNYVTAAGRIASESQTSYVLALEFDLMPDSLRGKALDYLVADIKGRGNHLSTGFLGTPYLCHVLSSHGRADVGYDLLLQKTFPSWLYPVTMGATTIWERWDGQKTDSTFQDVGMNSFNHYAYGAIGDWMYRVVAGIEIGSPGYQHILIQPHPDKRLAFAKASFESSYGKIGSGWKINGNTISLNLDIPANTSATIVLPGTTADKVKESGTAINGAFKNVQQKGSDLVIETGSGSYSFEYTTDSPR